MQEASPIFDKKRSDNIRMMKGEFHMFELIPTDNLDKKLLAEKITDQFRSADKLFYKRALLEIFDDKGKFLGDDLFETTFKLVEEQAPIIYEISGPYDTVSKKYATIAKIYHNGEMVYQLDLKAGIFQRTAAMIWLYLDTLKHNLGNVLLYGAGKVGRQTVEYIKFFKPGFEVIDYQDLEVKVDGFEAPLKKIGVIAKYKQNPDLSKYDTIIMATSTNQCIIHEGNISSIKVGTVVVSVCTSSQSGEISKEIYGRKDVNIFLDYDLSKVFTEDMRKVNDLGFLQEVIYYRDILLGKQEFDLNSKINLIRLTGTPIQNVAVVDMVLGQKKNELGSSIPVSVV
jgi:hypothetical protein